MVSSGVNEIISWVWLRKLCRKVTCKVVEKDLEQWEAQVAGKGIRWWWMLGEVLKTFATSMGVLTVKSKISQCCVLLNILPVKLCILGNGRAWIKQRGFQVNTKGSIMMTQCWESKCAVRSTHILVFELDSIFSASAVVSTQLEKPVYKKKIYIVLLSYVYTLHFAINGGNALSFALSKYGKMFVCLWKWVLKANTHLWPKF